MRQGIFEITDNRPLNAETMELRLRGDTGAIVRPGQFVNILVDGCFLRRPLSVCDWDSESLTVVYRIAGHGTELLSRMRRGKLDILTGLGNGFDTGVSGERPLLIGGGLGFTPLYALAKALIKEGKKPHVILGFAAAGQIVYEDKFRALGCNVTVCTEDGSRGVKGYVTAAMEGMDYSYFYTCGPEAMFRAVSERSVTSGQFSFEQRMGCGFGACMGCSCETLYGVKRICREGPVLRKEEIKWQT